MKTVQGIPEIINDIAKRLMRVQQTIAVAQRVTSGNLQAALSRAENTALFSRAE